MSGQKPNTTAMMVARGVGAEIAFNSSGGVADWIMMLSIGAGGALSTVDGRGPWRVADAAKLASTSLNSHGGRIPIDENHATDLAAPQGRPAPARGWVTDLQARADGIYGKVDWSAPGAELMAQKAYRYISPVLIVDKAGLVVDLPRASLTNTPNLRGMAALNAQTDGVTNMDQLLAALRKILGLPDTADEAAILAAVRKEVGDEPTAAMQSIATAAGLAATADAATVLSTVTTLKAGMSLNAIAKAAGLKEGADQPAIVAAITALASGVPDTVKALQSELGTVTTSLNALRASAATEKATAFVDGAIRERRVGVKPLRDHYITMHAADPARVEKELGAFPKLGPSGALEVPPAEIKDGKVSLNAEQLAAAKLLGVSTEAYAKTLESERSAA